MIQWRKGSVYNSEMSITNILLAVNKGKWHLSSTVPHLKILFIDKIDRKCHEHYLDDESYVTLLLIWVLTLLLVLKHK